MGPEFMDRSHSSQVSFMGARSAHYKIQRTNEHGHILNIENVIYFKDQQANVGGGGGG